MNRTPYTEPEAVAEYETLRFSKGIGKLVGKREASILLDLTNRLKGLDIVLDLPCGTGRFGVLLSDFGTLLGVDASIAMLAETKRAHRQEYCNGLLRGDARALPFKSKSVDLIVCVRLSGHLDRAELERAFSEMIRVTRKFVIITLQDLWAPSGLLRLIGKRVAMRGGTWNALRLRTRLRSLEHLGVVLLKSRRLVPFVSETVFVLFRIESARSYL